MAKFVKLSFMIGIDSLVFFLNKLKQKNNYLHVDALLMNYFFFVMRHHTIAASIPVLPHIIYPPRTSTYLPFGIFDGFPNLDFPFNEAVLISFIYRQVRFL